MILNLSRKFFLNVAIFFLILWRFWFANHSTYSNRWLCKVPGKDCACPTTSRKFWISEGALTWRKPWRLPAVGMSFFWPNWGGFHTQFVFATVSETLCSCPPSPLAQRSSQFSANRADFEHSSTWVILTPTYIVLRELCGLLYYHQHPHHLNFPPQFEMSGFHLVPEAGGEPVHLPPGETVLGRGPLLGVSPASS